MRWSQSPWSKSIWLICLAFFLLPQPAALALFSSFARQRLSDPTSGEAMPARKYLDELEGLSDRFKSRHENNWNTVTGLPLAFFTPETSLGVGYLALYKFDPNQKKKVSTVLGTASYTVKNQSLFTLTPKMYYNGGKYELHGNLAISNYPNRFYGPSNQQLEPFETYREQNIQSYALVGYEFMQDIFIRTAIHRENRKLFEFEDSPTLAKIVEEQGKTIDIAAYHVSLEWDQRDFPQAPLEGRLFRLLVYDAYPRGLERFQRIDLDLRYYTSQIDGVTIATQFQMSDLRSKGEVPFLYKNTLGGGFRLRGYYVSEYMDLSMGLAQVEIRTPIAQRWEISSFIGVGKAASSLDALNSARDIWVGGGGVHFLFDEQSRTKLRLELGFAETIPSLYFLVGEGF